jgi:hypothetical protein
MESQPTPPAPAPPSTEPIPSLAEDLPELYRTILDRVAELERVGARAEAGRIRASATHTYSNAWDARAQRSLMSLLLRAERLLARPAVHRGWSLRRRSVPVR